MTTKSTAGWGYPSVPGSARSRELSERAGTRTVPVMSVPPEDGQEPRAHAAHSHLVEFPEALETLLARLPELVVVLGGRSAEGVARLQALVQQALAARDRGDIPGAARQVLTAMRELAQVAGRSGVPEAPMLAAMAERFAAPLLRGDIAEARGAADLMREQSGATLIPRRPER